MHFEFPVHLKVGGMHAMASLEMAVDICPVFSILVHFLCLESLPPREAEPATHYSS